MAFFELGTRGFNFTLLTLFELFPLFNIVDLYYSSNFIRGFDSDFRGANEFPFT